MTNLFNSNETHLKLESFPPENHSSELGSTVINQKSFLCDICEEAFFNQDEFNQHYSNHSSGTIFGRGLIPVITVIKHLKNKS
ncbi:hypothetical protein HNY73_019052 [Argiope bruennichi]|uniref:C2H2-type domain-containing protein n=1 Tax=Argiope bruennichi TaxID=94029 RepID=A0A8T0EFI5_ARGBR|nr:hypothetical protein HNY73_019052 [Argiope bruennichi]